MPTTPGDDMSIREIARTLSDFRNEFRSQVQQLLRADLYRAEQAQVEHRLSALERDRERDEQERAANRVREEQERAANRRLVVGAFMASGLSFVSALILALVN
jgi:hypothetical protein